MRMVAGMGLNDANYIIRPLINGKRVTCPYYKKWENMLNRCYNPLFHSRRPSYTECSVSEDWLLFSKFRSWMELQDWEGNQLDKDLLVIGNKVYSPKTCIFLSGIVNRFMENTIDLSQVRSIGCNYSKEKNKFKAECRNPFTGKKRIHWIF